jgi:hypothetical protein
VKGAHVTKFSKPIGIKDYLEQDGSFMLQVEMPSGQVAEIAFSRGQALNFVETFQDATLRAAIASSETENAPTPRFLGFELKRVLVGHSLPQPELLITTDEFAGVRFETRLRTKSKHSRLPQRTFLSCV